MFLRHKSDNEEEINQESKTLLEEKEKLVDEWARLRKEREDLNNFFFKPLWVTCERVSRGY